MTTETLKILISEFQTNMCVCVYVYMCVCVYAYVYLHRYATSEKEQK